MQQRAKEFASHCPVKSQRSNISETKQNFSTYIFNSSTPLKSVQANVSMSSCDIKTIKCFVFIFSQSLLLEHEK